MSNINKLYRRNNQGTPCVWYASLISEYSYNIYHGIVGKELIKNTINCSRKGIDEITSKYNEKRKQGYKYLEEIKDDTILSPVKENDLFNYLNTYLPYDRTTADGTLLPMLAKSYTSKCFDKVPLRYGQYKINGLRCFISAKRNIGDMFKPITLLFQSREGTYWKSLYNLEEYLLQILPEYLIEKMLEEDWQLDGEVYLPGYSINEINHFVKDPTCIENKLIQYWCYDLSIQNTIQDERFRYLSQITIFNDYLHKNQHLNNKDRFTLVPYYNITNDDQARKYRDHFIDLGFEGLILRDPNAEYQYGKRNNTMIKYKDICDGTFEIIDIYPEGTKRDIPLFLCRNDLNNNTFEVHINGSMAYQRDMLTNRNIYIGKQLYISFGERSGVEKVPFHVKEVRLQNK